MKKIFLIDDEQSILAVLGNFFRANQFEVVCEVDCEKALERVAVEKYDLMISDIRMSPIDGIQLLERARKENPSMPVIMLTAYGSRESAEKAMQLGAFGFMMKPFNLPELLLMVKRALEHSGLPGLEQRGAEPAQSVHGTIEDLIGESDATQMLRQQIAHAALQSTPLLICGEHGTGKKVAAGLVHALGGPDNGLFIARNCAVLPEPLLDLELFGFVKGAFRGEPKGRAGVFEQAGGGTVMLEEISWMPRTIQAKLAAAISRKSFKRVKGSEPVELSSRLIGTTDGMLNRVREEGSMIDELLAIMIESDYIEIKPLRERTADIMPLLRHFLSIAAGVDAAQWEVQNEAQQMLFDYAWPGNVAELSKLAGKLAVSAENRVITVELLSAAGLKS